MRNVHISTERSLAHLLFLWLCGTVGYLNRTFTKSFVSSVKVQVARDPEHRQKGTLPQRTDKQHCASYSAENWAYYILSLKCRQYWKLSSYTNRKNTASLSRTVNQCCFFLNFSLFWRLCETHKLLSLCYNSGFLSGIVEVFSVLGFYAVLFRSRLTTLWGR